MTERKLKVFLQHHGASSPELHAIKDAYAHSPYVTMNTPAFKSEYSTCYYTIYENIETKKHYAVVLAHYKSDYILRCSDPYLEGKFTAETISKMIDAAFLKVDNQNLTSFKNLLTASSGTLEKSASCDFNTLFNEEPYTLCPHVKQFLHDHDTDILVTLKEKYKEGYYGGSKSLETMRSDLAQLFHRYAFKKPILLEGDKGSGKTHFVMHWAKHDRQELLFIGGHEQFESIDFLGHYIQQKDKTLVWKDGPLTQAFRRAQKGEKILLVIDEMLRIPQRELNILVAALSPIQGNYVLRTGRALEVVDDIAVEETLQAPMEKLWIVGTTNVGPQYAVDEIDEALADRFKTIRKDTDAVELEAILHKKALKKGFSKDAVAKLMGFYKKMSYLLESEELSKIVNVRHLTEAIDFADFEDQIVDIIYDTILTWVDRDVNGRPNRDQVQLIELAISRIWEVA